MFTETTLLRTTRLIFLKKIFLRSGVIVKRSLYLIFYTYCSRRLYAIDVIGVRAFNILERRARFSVVVAY